MADAYLLGIETQEIDAIPNPVQTIDTGIIAIIGRAADANETIWPLNTIMPICGSNGALQGLDSAGAPKDAIERIFDQPDRISQTILPFASGKARVFGRPSRMSSAPKIPLSR